MATLTNGQPDAMATLPLDILLEIFSYINQKDSLTCMDVCYNWYRITLLVADTIWKNVRFTEKDQYHNLFRDKMSLAKHVKHVTFESSDALKWFSPYALRELMTSLVSWRCTELESLEFIGCKVENLFVTLLEQLGHRLKRIRMIDQESAVSFAAITFVCPELTHFTYHQPNFGIGCLLDQYIEEADHCSKLTHLQLEVIIHQAHLDAILKRCPELRCVIIASRPRKRHSSSTSIDLDSLFIQCPKITTLVTTGCALHKLKIPSHANHDTDLCHFIADMKYPLDQMARHLLSNQSTLKYLRISQRKLEPGWSTMLGSLRMDQVRTLIIHIHVNTPSLIALLNHCPMLETLEIQVKKLRINLTAMQTLKPMRRLSLLTLAFVTLEDLPVLLERLPMLNQLVLDQAVVHATAQSGLRLLNPLRSLRLLNVVWQCEGSDAEVAEVLTTLTAGTKLTSVDLVHMTHIGDQPLAMIMQIPTLKSLAIPFDAVQDQAHFIKMLSAIANLSFYSAVCLTFSALVALGDLPILTMLDVQQESHPVHISKEGLLRMLHKSSSLRTVSLRRIRVEEDNGMVSYESLVRAIQQRVPQYRISGYEYKSPIPSNDRPRVLMRIEIKRV